MSYSSYRAYLNSHNNNVLTPTQQFKNNLQQISNDTFEIASNYYIVKHHARVTDSLLAATPSVASTPITTDVGVRLSTLLSIQRLTAIKDDFLKVTFKDFDYDVQLGDIFEFNSHRWLVVNTSVETSVTASALLQRCNLQLKFTEDEPLDTDIMVIDAVSSKYAMEELRDGQFIKLPDNKVEVWVPHNAIGRKIHNSYGGGTRFLIGDPYSNWMTTSYDSISRNRTDLDGNTQGIIRLELELSSINTGLDDLTNGVAWQDYF